MLYMANDSIAAPALFLSSSFGFFPTMFLFSSGSQPSDTTTTTTTCAFPRAVVASVCYCFHFITCRLVTRVAAFVIVACRGIKAHAGCMMMMSYGLPL